MHVYLTIDTDQERRKSLRANSIFSFAEYPFRALDLPVKFSLIRILVRVDESKDNRRAELGVK